MEEMAVSIGAVAAEYVFNILCCTCNMIRGSCNLDSGASVLEHLSWDICYIGYILNVYSDLMRAFKLVDVLAPFSNDHGC